MRTSKLRYLFRKLYLTIVNSIAFYPVLLSFFLLALAWGCLYLDTLSFGKKFMQEIFFLRVDQTETARSLLAALAGGLITLMVFSFSMVMVVLNQTASNYSPRVLPGLVSKPDHQIVLGIYLGAIGFTLAVLSNVGSEVYDDGTPRFSIIINLLLTFLSLAAFVYFIHEISSVIQIGKILKRLYLETHSSLVRELSSNLYTKEPVIFKKKVMVRAWTSGYFFKVSEKTLKKGAKDFNLQLRLLKNQGTYLVEGEPFLEINTDQNEEITNLLQESFIFRHQELIADNFFYGFKQITEVAVKALSPGINDPGTALQALNYLRDLLSLLFDLKGKRVIKDDNHQPLLVYASVSFQEVFYLCVSSIRNYAEKDVSVQVKLIQLIKRMQEKDKEDEFRDMFEEELKAVEVIADHNLLSKKDKEYIRQWISSAPAGSIT